MVASDKEEIIIYRLNHIIIILIIIVNDMKMYFLDENIMLPI